MKKKNPFKQNLHPRNKHRNSYDMKALCKSYLNLESFIVLNKTGEPSINFFDPKAVKALNKALLLHHYEIQWDIPFPYLCPPIPGRVDYIHHIGDLLASSFNKKIPKGKQVKGLDIGVGANCIYPLLGAKEYAWSFIASDIDKDALTLAQKNIATNPKLLPLIELREQKNEAAILKGILLKGELIDFTVCNPPFHASKEEADQGNIRKLRNLKGKKTSKPNLNFGGQNKELWCIGGEAAFVQKMIAESKEIENSCYWFTTLISKEKNLENAYKQLDALEAFEVKTISMQHGNKKSRILAWTFLNKDLQKKWVEFRWV